MECILPMLLTVYKLINGVLSGPTGVHLRLYLIKLTAKL